MVRYAVMVRAEKTDIKEIEFQRSRMIILYRDGTRAEYNYDFVRSTGGINIDS